MNVKQGVYFPRQIKVKKLTWKSIQRISPFLSNVTVTAVYCVPTIRRCGFDPYSPRIGCL